MPAKIKKGQKGFSLVELLIVVLTIGLIAAIAVPNLLAARRSANEGSAISSLRTLHSAQSLYLTSIGGGDYAGTIGSTGDSIALSELHSVKLIDESLGLGTKSGYNFVGARTLSDSLTPASFFFSANPISTSGITQSGTKRFCISQEGSLRFDWNSINTAFDESGCRNATTYGLN